MISIEYLAGLFDGEGCVLVLKNKRKHVVFYTVGLDIANNNREVLELSCELLKQQFGVDAKLFSSNVSKKGVVTYHLRVQAKRDALKVINGLLPYLIVKRDQALLAHWYLSRSCIVDKYKPNTLDVDVLEAISTLKRDSQVTPLVAAIVENVTNEVPLAEQARFLSSNP